LLIFSLKIRAEEDEDPVREKAKEKEVDPCAMMMDTTMFDEANPMMEWLNEDEEHIIKDGVEAATAVFEKIRSLNSRKTASRDSSRKRKRVVEEDEDEYIDSGDEDEEIEHIDLEDDDDDEGQGDDASESDGEDPSQGEKNGTNQVKNNIEITCDGSSMNRRSGRTRQAKKVKDVDSLYY
jgi:hypothetical protein